MVAHLHRKHQEYQKIWIFGKKLPTAVFRTSHLTARSDTRFRAYTRRAPRIYSQFRAYAALSRVFGDEIAAHQNQIFTM